MLKSQAQNLLSEQVFGFVLDFLNFQFCFLHAKKKIKMTLKTWFQEKFHGLVSVGKE